MWTKLLPEAGGSNLMFLPEAAGGGKKFSGDEHQVCSGGQWKEGVALENCYAVAFQQKPSPLGQKPRFT